MVTEADSPAGKAGSSRANETGARSHAGAPHDAGARRERWLDGAAIAIPTALAAALCLYGVTSRSLGFDEAATVTIAAQHGGALGSAIAHDGGNMSGYYLLLHVLIGLFGNGTLLIRLPSVLAMTATVTVVGLIGLRLFNRRVAFASGLLTAVSLPLISWGQEARGYAPMVALVSASFLAFVGLIEARRDGRSIRWAWIGYVVFTTVAVYSSFVAILVVPAQLITLIWYRRAARPMASALAAVAVLCTPLVALALDRGSGQLFWVPRPSWTGEKQVLEALTSAGLQPSFRPTWTTPVLLVLTTLLLVGLTALIVRRLWRAADGAALWGQTLTVAWLVVPVALAWVESLVGQPIFLPRNLLMAVPAVALLLALGIAHPGVPRWLGWTWLAVLLGLRALQLVPSYGVSPEDWQGATASVLARAQPGDCVAFYPSDGRMAFQYYIGARGPAAAARAPRSILPAVPWGEVRPYVEDYVAPAPSDPARLSAGCPRLWFVFSHEGQRKGPAGSRANYAGYLRLRSALEHQYSRRSIESFGYASAVQVELLSR